MSGSWHVGDRVAARDRPWRVARVLEAVDSRHLIEVEALDGDTPERLTLSSPPDEPILLGSEQVEFALSGLDSFQAWSNSHLLIAASSVKETGLLTGARFGRVALE